MANIISSNVRLNEINTTAYRHFLKNYFYVNGEHWYKTANGFTVIFRDDSVLTKLFYSKKGSFLCTLRYFDSKSANPQIKKLIDILYPKFTLSSIEEKSDGNQSIFECWLSGPDSTIVCTVYNSAVTDSHEFPNNTR